jgi:hypothetical protein
MIGTKLALSIKATFIEALTMAGLLKGSGFARLGSYIQTVLLYHNYYGRFCLVGTCARYSYRGYNSGSSGSTSFNSGLLGCEISYAKPDF